jgi:hypothetical protein
MSASRPDSVQRCALSPIYLQHQGHSRTIVGVEKRRVTGANNKDEYLLLVLDPAKKGNEMVRTLSPPHLYGPLFLLMLRG